MVRALWGRCWGEEAGPTSRPPQQHLWGLTFTFTTLSRWSFSGCTMCGVGPASPTTIHVSLRCLSQNPPLPTLVIYSCPMCTWLYFWTFSFVPLGCPFIFCIHHQGLVMGFKNREDQSLLIFLLFQGFPGLPCLFIFSGFACLLLKEGNLLGHLGRLC